MNRETPRAATLRDEERKYPTDRSYEIERLSAGM
jgi:hypothetical protein